MARRAARGEIVWSASEFDGFRHGYAGTTYKGQGKTLDHTYLLHTHHWRRSSAYVALTRQRESAQIFAATETAQDLREFARQMARGEVKSASVTWATREELPAALRSPAEASARQEERDRRRRCRLTHWSVDRNAGRAPSGPILRPRLATTTGAREGEGWLIPPRVSPDGSDSRGRGLDRASVAFAITSDRAVLREREALGSYLDGTYRDPDVAKTRLGDLVGREGHTSAAERVAADPRPDWSARGPDSAGGARHSRAGLGRDRAGCAPHR